MTSLLAVSAIVTVAAITPGPNNFIVMSAAARGGPRAALPAIAGVIGGSIALLAVVSAGAGAVFEAVPAMQTALRVAGAVYLVWLGLCLIRAAGDPSTQRAALPETALGVAGFQLLNPKSWVLVITAVAAVGGTLADVVSLAVVFLVVMSSCLALWSLAGQMISRRLTEPRAKRLFDRVMGGLLVLSAVALLP